MDFPARAVFSGVSHTGKTPQIVLDDTQRLPWRRSTVSILNTTISLKRFRSRYCTGRYDLGTFEAKPCPTGQRLDSDSPSQCEACRRASGFNPAFYNVLSSELSESQQAYNAEPHNVYLAGFGAGLIKVGISSTRRMVKRWKEQGALAVCVVGCFPNAYEARHAEARISARLGIGETVSSAAKAAALANLVDFDSCLETLESSACAARDFMGAATPVTVTRLLESYCGEGVDLHVLKGMINIGTSSPLVFGGRVIAAIGDLLIADYRGGRICCSAARFESHFVEAAHTVPDINVPAHQLTLL
jgi:hypothetical protein